MPPAPAGTTVPLPRVASAAPALSPLFDADTRTLLWRWLLILHIAAGGVLLVLTVLHADGSIRAPSLGVLPAWWSAIHWVQLVQCVAGAAFLRWRPEASLRALRFVELVHFGTAIIGSGLDKYARLAVLPVGAVNDPVLAIGHAATTSQLSFIMIVVVYGGIIPNTPRRSLAGVGMMIAVAFLGTLGGAAANPALQPHLATLLIMCAVQLTMPGLVAVLVASRNHALRRAVFEARREAEPVGQYALKRKLGEGGMGEVWLAEHRLLKRPCAVKFVRAELAAHPTTAARFEREVRAVTALTHFNTVRVYDYGRADDGSFYYVMEYLDGPTLEDMVNRAGPLAPGRAVYLLRQLCGALVEAHAAGLVHRDLKPGNVIVAALGGQRDVAKLLDFGLVQDLSMSDADGARLTQAGVVMGTPAYMCPEQAGGSSAVDARGDIYGLGAVAFFMLTGRPPFDCATVGEYIAAHLTRPAPDVRAVRPDVPTDLDAVVAKCLAKDPKERFQSVAELEAALGACACAADWTAARAAGWWAREAPAALPVPAVPTAPFHPPEPT